MITLIRFVKVKKWDNDSTVGNYGITATICLVLNRIIIS